MSNNNAPLPSSFDSDPEFFEEGTIGKLGRRLKEEPLIPLGILLTSAALYEANKSIKAGDHNRVNRMFRARIYAQFFTIVAMVIGSIYWKTDRQKRREYDAAMKEQKAMEKRVAWIKELEARDVEDQELRAAKEAAKEARRKAGGGGVAASIIDERERRKGTLEMVMELVHRRR